MIRRTVIALLLASLAAAAGRAQTVYIAFGDSVTFGTGAEPNARGYPARLHRKLEQQGGLEVEVDNHGLAGETTVGGVTRIDQALAIGGDVLLLMEGTNDIPAGISRETTLQNLASMASKAANKGIPTIHATVIPRAPFARRDADNRQTTLLNYGIRQMALNRDRTLADPFEVFLAQPNLFRDLYSKQSGDQTGHPNPDGYELLAQVFADVILERDTVPPVPVEVEPSNGAVDVSRRRTIVVRIADFGTGPDEATARLMLNGEPVDSQIQAGERSLTLRHTPPQPLLGVYDVSYEATDFASPANSITKVVARFQTQGTTFFRGDLNRDGQVDGSDLVILGARFGGRRGQDSLYFAAFDLNSDGVLDGEDLAILARNFGRRSF